MTTNWTKVNKASGTSWTKVSKPTYKVSTNGSPIGLLLALTYATTAGTQWTKVNKASGTAWAKLNKAT